MLENEHFYFHSIRKTTAHFGSLFNKIVFQNDGYESPPEDFYVPLEFAPREYFIARLNGNSSNDGKPNVARTLPRITFQINSYEPDPSRQTNSTIRIPAAPDGDEKTVRTTKWNLVPYNISFQLSVFARRYEDTLQIVEQILPYFTPHYTLNIVFSEELGIQKDVPVILQSNEPSDEWEQGRTDFRLMTHNFNFQVQTYIIPPITDSEFVKEVRTNFHFDENQDVLEQFTYE